MKIEIGDEYQVGKINVGIILRPYEWHKIIVTNLAVIDNDTWIYFSDEVQYSGQIYSLKLTLEKFKSYITDDPRYEVKDPRYKVKESKKPIDLDYQNINDRLTNLENKFKEEIESLDNGLGKMSTDIYKNNDFKDDFIKAFDDFIQNYKERNNNE